MLRLKGLREKMQDRKELLKKAGNVVLVIYKKDCFVIGWFYSMTEDAIHLKITSTRFESYESRSVPLEEIISVEEIEMA